MARIPWFDSNKSLTTSTFESLYKKLALPLMKFIVKRMGGNQEAAEEVFAKTTAAAWEGWNAFEHKSSYFTWICRIALNKIADYYREEIHKESIFVAPILEKIAEANLDELSPTERLSLDELRISLRACVKLLPQDKKQLLFMRYWRQLTIKQISQRLGLSERAIEGRLYRARCSLKQLFEGKYPEFSKIYSHKER
jgi:RNA polymerase sigma-70 factor (ECF subfamily)